MNHWKRTCLKVESTVLEAMLSLESTALQICLIVNEDGGLEGTITDGDVRRFILHGGSLDSSVALVMNSEPQTISVGDSRYAAHQVMERLALHAIPVVSNDGRVVDLILQSNSKLIIPNETTVMIMAGGFGKRLMPITQDKPKPLVEISGQPLIEILLRRLERQGFRKVWISVGYLAQNIVDRIGSGEQFGLNIEYVIEHQPLGTAGAILQLPSHVVGAILTCNADIVSSIDFAELIHSQAQSGASATVAARRHLTEIPYGVLVESGNQIQAINEKPVLEHIVSVGVNVIDLDAVKQLDLPIAFDMNTLITQLLEAGHAVETHLIDGYWIDVGNLDALKRARDENQLA